LLEALAGHVATAIENARLFGNERKEKDRMISELNEARSVQLSLFPAWTPDIPGFEITGLCIPCREVGGDWFDYILLPDGRLGLVLGDVSGKGTGAALLMASARSIIRMFAERGLPPGEVLLNVNRILVADLPRTRFVTMIYAIIDPASKSILFANAGHLPPIFNDSNGLRFLDSDSGLPLGIQEGTFAEQRVEMSSGSCLLLYSDGITEAMNSVSEEYGEERLKEHMTNPVASIQSLLESVNVFLNGFPASDDMTVVMIKSQE
jgi:sigma-B regulation protein RsbU (phosphoserine phosphatase)